MGFTKINHICYADDAALVTLSLKGLQELIYICQIFGKYYDVILNVDKIKCMVFKPKSYTKYKKI